MMREWHRELDVTPDPQVTLIEKFAADVPAEIGFGRYAGHRRWERVADIPAGASKTGPPGSTSWKAVRRWGASRTRGGPPLAHRPRHTAPAPRATRRGRPGTRVRSAPPP